MRWGLLVCERLCSGQRYLNLNQNTPGRPKAKKIYQKFGKLVEKGVEDFFREQELQINAIRIEAILNGEKVHDVEAMRGRLRQIFSRLQYVICGIAKSAQ